MMIMMMMHNPNVKHAVLVTGAIEIITKSFNKNLEDIPGKKSTYLVQKTDILGIPHLIREALQSET